MWTTLIHIHWLLADEKNFQAQTNVNFGIAQYAVNYRPFVDSVKWQQLVEKIANDIALLLSGMFPEDDFIFHGNSAWWVLVAQLATHPELTEKTTWVIFNCSAWLGEELGKSIDSIFWSLSRAKNKNQLKDVINEFVQIPQVAIPEWLVEEIYELIVTNRTENLIKLLRRWAVFTKEGAAVQWGFREALSKINKMHMSTLVIWGAHDTVTPPVMIQQMASLLDVDPIVFCTWHIPHIQEPALFNAELMRFISSVQKN